MNRHLPVGIVSLVIAAGVLPNHSLGAEDTSLERFLFVEAWAGRISITGTGEGEIPSAGVTITYKVQRNLDYSFALTTLMVGTWTTCVTASSFGVIHDRMVSRDLNSGCVNEYLVDASAP